MKKKDPTISAVKSIRKDPFEVSKDTKGVPSIESYNINKKDKKVIEKSKDLKLHITISLESVNMI